MSERRKTTRRKSLLRGRVLYNNQRNSVDCMVRDISNRGARLIFSDAAAVPDVIDVYIPQKELTLRAHVNWRQGQELGVTFATVAAPAPGQFAGPDDLAGRVERLEAEIVLLKKMLKRLRAEIANSDAA